MSQRKAMVGSVFRIVLLIGPGFFRRRLLHIEILKADEGETSENAAAPECKGGGETGGPRGNPPTNGIVRHDSHLRKSEGDPAGSGTLYTLRWEASSLTTTSHADRNNQRTHAPSSNETPRHFVYVYSSTLRLGRPSLPSWHSPKMSSLNCHKLLPQRVTADLWLAGSSQTPPTHDVTSPLSPPPFHHTNRISAVARFPELSSGVQLMPSPLTTAGHTHLHVFLIRCPGDKRRRSQCYVGLYRARCLIFSAPFTGRWRGVSATVFRKVLLQSRSCPGSMSEGVISVVIKGNILTRADLLWRSRLVRHRSGVPEALGSNPGQGVDVNLKKSLRPVPWLSARRQYGKALRAVVNKDAVPRKCEIYERIPPTRGIFIPEQKCRRTAAPVHQVAVGADGSQNPSLSENHICLRVCVCVWTSVIACRNARSSCALAFVWFSFETFITIPECHRRSSAETQGREKRQISEKTHRPMASSNTISTCENLGVTRPGIEVGSYWLKTIQTLFCCGIVPDDTAGRQVFSGISRYPPALSFRRCSVLTSVTPIRSQDLAVKSRPNLFTHSLFCCGLATAIDDVCKLLTSAETEDATSNKTTFSTAMCVNIHLGFGTEHINNLRVLFFGRVRDERHDNIYSKRDHKKNEDNMVELTT
ncbi:hypothetical protein PR048_027295 [Dryococelus australis]|uniref:Uncharacterized protein n=1 Tax=Dryococelus australis TaxID=614101 RepID=A0ABQ9GFI6_9NEOP|nr:hypothetical protein PR048_027295 [Dryococelus australis]